MSRGGWPPVDEDPPIGDVEVELRATVSPSEDPSKVLAAMRNVFGECDYAVEQGPDSIRLRSTSSRCLQKLHDQLRDRRVRGAARKRFLLGRSGDSTTVMMNRQAAAAGVVALCDSEEESPLGPLNLTIASDDLDAVIQWLTDFPSG